MLKRVDGTGKQRAAALPAVSEKLDRVGVGASLICAIHCALMPFVVAILPLLGVGFLASRPVEWGLILLSAALGSLSLCLGFREHQSKRIFAVLGLAILFLLAGRIGEEREIGWLGPVLMVAGGLTMVGAHWLNRRLCRTCQACNLHENS